MTVLCSLCSRCDFFIWIGWLFRGWLWLLCQPIDSVNHPCLAYFTTNCRNILGVWLTELEGCRLIEDKSRWIGNEILWYWELCLASAVSYNHLSSCHINLSAGKFTLTGLHNRTNVKRSAVDADNWMQHCSKYCFCTAVLLPMYSKLHYGSKYI